MTQRRCVMVDLFKETHHDGSPSPSPPPGPMFPLVFLYFVMVFCVFLALQLKTLCFSFQISCFSAPIVIFFEFSRFFQHLHRPVFSCFLIIFSGLASDYLFFTFFVFLAFTIKNLMFLIHKLHIFGVACVFFRAGAIF